MSRRTALVTCGAVALGLGAGWRIWGERTPVQPAPTGAGAGHPAVDPQLWSLQLQRPEGGLLPFESLRGRPLILNFWATWCPPCIKELPELDRFAQSQSGREGSRQWQVVGVAVDGPTPVREFLQRRPLSFPIGLAGMEGSEWSRRLGNPQGGLPFTAALSAEGALIHRKLGPTTFDELNGWSST